MTIIIFKLGDREFGVNIDRIRQVVRVKNITAVPDSPSYILGVTNLRGRVVTVIDLHEKLGFGRRDLPGHPKMMVTGAAGEELGFVVDSVANVVKVPPEALDKAHEVLKEAEYLDGVVRDGSRLLLVMDLVRTLEPEDKSSIKRTVDQVKIERKKGV